MTQWGLLREVGNADELDTLQDRAAGYDVLPVVQQAQDTVERQHRELTDRLARQVEQTAAAAGDWLATQRRAWEQQLSAHMERLSRQAAEALARPQVPFPFSAPVPPGAEHLVGAMQARPGDLLGAQRRAQQVAAAETTVTPEEVESLVGGARGMVSGLAEVPGTVTRPAAAAAEAFGRGAYGEAALRAGEAGLLALPENLAVEAAARMAAGIVRESPRYGTEAQRLAAAPVVEEVVRQAAYAPALAEVGLGGVRAAGELAQVAPQVLGRVAAGGEAAVRFLPRAVGAVGDVMQATPSALREAAGTAGRVIQAAVPAEAYRVAAQAMRAPRAGAELPLPLRPDGPGMQFIEQAVHDSIVRANTIFEHGLLYSAGEGVAAGRRATLWHALREEARALDRGEPAQIAAGRLHEIITEIGDIDGGLRTAARLRLTETPYPTGGLPVRGGQAGAVVALPQALTPAAATAVGLRPSTTAGAGIRRPAASLMDVAASALLGIPEHEATLLRRGLMLTHLERPLQTARSDLAYLVRRQERPQQWLVDRTGLTTDEAEIVLRQLAATGAEAAQRPLSTTAQLSATGPSLRALEFGGVPAAPATTTEVAAGRAGAVAGGVLGATAEPEGAEAPPVPLERAGRAVTGALVGGTGAGAAVRLAGMAARGAEAVRAGEEVAAAAARGRLPRDQYLAGLRAREAARLETRAEALRAGLEQRYARWEALQQRLTAAETRLEAETSVTGIDRPAWAARRGSTRAFTDRELIELAAEQSRGMPNPINPYVEGWGASIDPAVVEQWRTERLSARTGTAAQAGMTPREQASAAQVLRAEVRGTRQELAALHRDVERQLGHAGLLEDRAAEVMAKAESAAGAPSGGGLPPAADDVQTVLRRVLAQLGEVRAAAPAGTLPPRRAGDVRAGQPIGRAIAAGVEAAPGETVAAASRAGFVANVRLATFPEQLRPFVQQAVDRLPVEAVDVARRGVLGEAAVQRLAGELGLTVQDFLRRARPGRTYSAEELIALDQTFAHTAAQIKEQSSRLASGAVTVAGQDTARTELAALVLQATGLARAAVGARAEAGRALGAMRYLRQAVEAAPAAPHRLRRALQLIGDTDTLTPDLVQKLAAAADDPVELFSLVRQAQTPSWWERFSTYYRFNLLSNPLTQVRNLVGNTGAMAMVPVERLAAAVAEAAITPKTGAQAVGAALGAVGGGAAGGTIAGEEEAGPLPLAAAIATGAAGGLVAGRNIGTLVTLARGGRAALPARERFFAEVLTDAEGWAWAQALAWRRVGTILSRGYSDADAVRMELRHKAITAGIGSQALARAVGVLELPFRALSAGDAYFATMAEYGELFTQAARQVREQSLTGTAARTELLRLVATPTAELAAAAEHAASYRTYNQTLDGLGKWLRGPGAFMPAGRARNIANAAWSLVFPFVSTPYNIAKYELERSPLGALSVAKGALQGERGGALSDRIGRLLVGSAVFTAALWYAQDDNLTGAGPRTPAERDLWVREHRQPYSIRINGQWYSYAQLTGLSTTLALAAELAAAQKVSERGLPASRVVRAVWDAGRVATEKPYLQGLRRLEEAIANPDRAAALLEATAANVVPAAAVLGAVARATDLEPETGELVQRAPEGLVERVAAGVPGLRAGVPERLTAFGRTATRTGGLQVGPVAVEPLVNPLTRSEAQEDPIDRELRRLVEATGQGAGPAPVTRTAKIAGQELTREQRQQLQQLSGPAAYEALAQLFLTGEYLRATTDARRVALVHGAIGRARVEASEQLVPRALRQRAG